MSDELEMDPEVIADIKLRAATERDPTRSRKLPRFEPSPTVGHWPCRNNACQMPCEVTQAGVEMFDMFNKLLVKRGEQPISTEDVLVCDICRRFLDRHAEQKAGERDEQMRRDVKRLRAAKDPDRELAGDELLKKRLERWHPDLYGLLESLRHSKNKNKRARPEEVSGG